MAELKYDQDGVPVGLHFDKQDFIAIAKRFSRLNGHGEITLPLKLPVVFAKVLVNWQQEQIKNYQKFDEVN